MRQPPLNPISKQPPYFLLLCLIFSLIMGLLVSCAKAPQPTSATTPAPEATPSPPPAPLATHATDLAPAATALITPTPAISPSPIPTPTPQPEAIPGITPPPQPLSQLEAGRTVFNSSCARCHGVAGEGAIGPPLTGAKSVVSNYRNAQDLFSFISRFMPVDAPGSLPQQQYLEVLAYILQSNGYLKEGTILSLDKLAGISLTR